MSSLRIKFFDRTFPVALIDIFITRSLLFEANKVLIYSILIPSVGTITMGFIKILK